MVYKNSLLKVLDNSGIKLLKVIKILGYKPQKSNFDVGCILVCSVKKTFPLARRRIKSSKGDVVRALLIQVKKNKFRQNYGNYNFKSSNSLAVIVNKEGVLLGSRIKSYVSMDLKYKNNGLKILVLSSLKWF